MVLKVKNYIIDGLFCYEVYFLWELVYIFVVYIRGNFVGLWVIFFSSYFEVIKGKFFLNLRGEY